MRVLHGFPGRLVILVALCAVTGLVAFFVATPARAASPAYSSAWSIVSSPNAGAGDNTLGRLAVVAADDIWAVGNSTAGGTARRTLIEHWNGASWRVVPSPNSSDAINYLTAVTAVSSNDVWAAGFSSDGSLSKTLIEHWDGSSWRIVPSPNPTATDLGPYPVSNQLYGVARVAANDIWAVGQSSTIVANKTLIEHWDGSSWQVVANPRPGRFSALYDVAVVAPNNVWAVGNYDNNGLQQALVERWDGTSWRAGAGANVGPYLNTFLSISAVSANDIWAVGYHLAVFGFTEVYQTSAIHWDGRQWSPVATANANQRNNYLYSVAAITPQDVWAVGFYDTGTQLLTLTEHWNGTGWNIVASPNFSGSTTNELFGMARDLTGAAWAVGNYFDGFRYRTLIEHCTSSCIASVMHVAGIDPSFKPSGGGFTVKARVTVQDATALPLAGAFVAVKITGPTGSMVTRLSVTNRNGVATLATTGSERGAYTFTVLSIAKSGWVYEPAANVETSDSVVIP